MLAKLFLGTAALVVVVLSLHTTALDGISIWGVKPDLLLAIVVYVSLMRGAVAGVFTGFVLGLLQDAQSHHTLGFNALAKAVVGYAASQTWDALDKNSVYAQMAVIFGAGILHNAIFLGLYTGSQLETFPRIMARVGLPGALYTAVLTPLLVAVLTRLLGYRMEFRASSVRQR